MGIPKKSDELVLRILQTLKKSKDILTPTPADAGQEPGNSEGVLNPETIEELNGQFENIEAALRKVNDLLPNVNRWEEHLFNEFTNLEEEIDGYSLENNPHSDEFVKKLQNVAERLRALETSILKLEVESDDSSSVSQEQRISEIEYPTKLVDWTKLSIGDRLIQSREIRYLMASFEHLKNPQSKMCALYYSIFPEDWVISKRQMTYWWISESWAVGKVAVDAADDIFQDHVNQGLIKPFFKRKDSFNTKYFTIHPWIHRKLISIAKEAQLFDFGPNGIPKDSQRRSFLFQSDEQDSRQVNNVNGNQDMALTSVINISRKYLNFKAVEISRWKKVVALQLGRWRSSPKHHIEVESEEFLKRLKGLKFLKYLGLRGISRITTLPNSITKLVSLEILDVQACHNLEKLPDISPLRNLTHLDLSECYLVENIPKGIGKLSKLQVLKGFVIGRKKSSSKISDIVNLKLLRKLSIYIGSKATSEQEETELGMLKKIPSLRILTIIWTLNSSTSEISATGGEVTPPTPEQKNAIESPNAFPRNGEEISTSNPNLPKTVEANLSISNPEPSLSSVPSSTGKNPVMEGGAVLSRAGTRTAIESVRGSLSLPEGLQKLDLRCVPYQDLPDWLNPDKLMELKKLYIRGGKLEKLTCHGNETWKIKILRLKYLRSLNVEEGELQTMFPRMIHVEKTKCGGPDFVKNYNGLIQSFS